MNSIEKLSDNWLGHISIGKYKHESEFEHIFRGIQKESLVIKSKDIYHIAYVSTKGFYHTKNLNTIIKQV